MATFQALRKIVGGEQAKGQVATHAWTRLSEACRP